MTTYWRCQTCTDSGEGDREADRHVKATKHSVLTSARKGCAPFGLAPVPLLSGLPSDAEKVSDLSPRVAHEAHLVDCSLDVAVDVVATGDEGLEAGRAPIAHLSRLVDSDWACQEGLTS